MSTLLVLCRCRSLGRCGDGAERARRAGQRKLKAGRSGATAHLRRPRGGDAAGHSCRPDRIVVEVGVASTFRRAGTDVERRRLFQSPGPAGNPNDRSCFATNCCALQQPRAYRHTQLIDGTGTAAGGEGDVVAPRGDQGVGLAGVPGSGSNPGQSGRARRFLAGSSFGNLPWGSY